ncbi:hypothetical protein EDB19DRAFT_1825597 [Suillus lakei]|nr:hypothetical protein EDB19DRAFT_1825597 [Suillus lakei]
MPPCKGKGKKNDAESGGLIKGTNQLTKSTTETNAFKLDMHPVEAKVNKDDQVAKIQHLDAALKQAKIGIGKLELLQMDNKIVFGTYNDCPKKLTEVNKMLSSFKNNGVQWSKVGNTLAVIIDCSCVVPDEGLDGDWNAPMELVHVKFLDTNPIVFTSGQHRYAALKKMAELYLEEHKTIEKRLTQLQDMKRISDDAIDEHKQLRELLMGMKGNLANISMWGVTLYNKGLSLDRPMNVGLYGTHPDSGLDGIPAALNVLEVEFAKPASEKQLKFTKVLTNARLMLTLMHSILPMGPHFCHRCELTIHWLTMSMDIVMGMYTIYMANSVTLYQMLASKDDFPTLAEVTKLIVMSDADDEHGANTSNKLKELQDQIIAGKMGSKKIFVPYMEQFNKAMFQCFGTYTGNMGTWSTDYQNGLQDYRNEVNDILTRGWMNQALHLKEEMDKLNRVIACMVIWLTAIPQECVPMPLMTGMVLDKVWLELMSVKEGYKEMSQWFEAIVDTMKAYVPNTHAVNDVTDAMFCSVERGHGKHAKEHAVQAVWTTLWEGQSNTVLQLHNKMSTAEMKKKMAKRPVNKEAFKVQWGQVSDSLQKKVEVLYDTIKPYIGKALIATGWDWQREVIKKHARREAVLVTQGIIKEVHFVGQYQCGVLTDPMEQVETNRRLASESVDRDGIVKVLNQIAALPMARNSVHKNSPLSIEVANVLNKLGHVCTYGVDTCQFNPDVNVTKLSLPEIEDDDEVDDSKCGVNTDADDGQAGHEQEGQLQDMEDQQEESHGSPSLPMTSKAPVTSTPKAKGKGKASHEVEDEEVDIDAPKPSAVRPEDDPQNLFTPEDTNLGLNEG